MASKVVVRDARAHHFENPICRLKLLHRLKVLARRKSFLSREFRVAKLCDRKELAIRLILAYIAHTHTHIPITRARERIECLVRATSASVHQRRFSLFFSG